MSPFGFMVIGIVALCCSASCLIAAVAIQVRARRGRVDPPLRARQHGRKEGARSLRKGQREKGSRLPKSSRRTEAGPVSPGKTMHAGCGDAGHGPAVREVPAARGWRMGTGGDSLPDGRAASSRQLVSERATELLYGEEATQFLADEEELWRVLDER